MEKIKQKLSEIDSTNTKPPVVDEDLLKNNGLKNIKLRDYQVVGVEWLAQRHARAHGSILGDEMGLGKTCQTISFLVYLHGCKKETNPFLILSPLSVMSNWQNELARFAPGLTVIVYSGSKESREKTRLQIKKSKTKFHVLLTTYELCLKDESFLRRYHWGALVVDEAHRLKNRHSLLHQALLDFPIDHHVLLTGTPVQNNLSELYSLLCFVAPHIFKEKYTETFVQHFSEINENNDTAELHKILKPFLLRRIKSEVVKDLPKKSEVVLYHGMSAVQKKYYRAILTKDLSLFENVNSTSKTQLLNILMQLRKCVNHPYLFDGVEPEPFMMGEHLVEASGKLMLIDQLLSYLHPRGHKVLLFSQMTRMLDIIQDYLAYRDYNYERLDGSVRGEERYLAVKNFNEDSDTFVFLLSTKAGGQGLNLTSADTVIFVDSDFNPQNDLQAAARAHRIGQTRPVKVLRLLGRSTVEEIILKRAEAKLKLTSTVIEGGQFSGGAGKDPASSQLIADTNIQLSDILKFGVDRLLSSEDSSIEDVDFDSILGHTSEKGEWEEEKEEEVQAKASLALASMDMDEAEPMDDGGGTGGGGESMYVFEGTDYSKEPSTQDMDFFEKMLEAEKALDDVELGEGRSKRGKNTALLTQGLLLPERKPRKPLTQEELEERRKKREELAERRVKQAEEAENRKAEQKKKRREVLWKANNYTSLAIQLPDSDDDDDDDDNGDNNTSAAAADDGDGENDDDDDESNKSLQYVVGDVSQPQNTGNGDAIVIHCVDDSGVWGHGGLFSALSRRSTLPEEHYELAAKMKDIQLGDSHLIPLDDKQQQRKDYCMLLVCQHRDRRNNLSGIQLPELQRCLQKVCHTAKKHAASVHCARIGYNTPNFNWYGTERLLRKELVSKGVPTYIYYYKRHVQQKRQASLSPSPSPPAKLRRISSSSSTNDDQQPSTSATNNTDDAAASRGAKIRKTGSLYPLPDFLARCTVYFHSALEEDNAQTLRRYLIAFGGDVCSVLDERTTIVIVPEDADDDELQCIIEFSTDHPSVPVVSGKWLHDSCVHQKCLPTEKYRQDQ